MLNNFFASNHITLNGITVGVSVAVSAVILIMYIIAMWSLFKKAGISGWKSLVPIYNYYLMYKISWSPFMFWINVLLSILISVLRLNDSTTYVVLAIFAGIILAIINLVQTVKLGRAYGRGFAFILGLIFLNTLFVMILGLGRSIG